MTEGELRAALAILRAENKALRQKGEPCPFCGEDVVKARCTGCGVHIYKRDRVTALYGKAKAHPEKAKRAWFLAASVGPDSV